MADKTRILVTSALPYINGVKHLGNLVGSMLPADVYARYQRQRLGAENVLFICATDEHGTPAELAALEEGRSIKEYCDYWHAAQKHLYDGFYLSFDYFGRSSSAQNRTLTQTFAKTLWEAGFIDERVTKQVFSRAENRFLPDRYVTGTARGYRGRRAAAPCHPGGRERSTSASLGRLRSGCPRPRCTEALGRPADRRRWTFESALQPRCMLSPG